MNFIQNVSLEAVRTGRHTDAGDRAFLIQIGDPCSEFPRPKAYFEEVFQFEFLDVDDSARHTPYWDFRMQPVQARGIVSILQRALDEKRNIIVHCHAGICRSGAVAEVGEMLGFASGNTNRIPNVWVKKLLMRELGWIYEND